MWIQSTISTINLIISLFSGAIHDPQSDLEKTLNFQACLQGSKNQKSHTQGLQKTPEFDSRIIKKKFLLEHRFRKHSLRKPGFKSSNCQEFHSQIGAKTERESSLAQN